MVKFNFLAQFLVDHLAQPVVSSLMLMLLGYCIHLLHDWSFHLYYHKTYICYFVMSCLFLRLQSSYGVFLCCQQKRFSFLRSLPFLSYVQVLPSEISLICRVTFSYSRFSLYFCFLSIFVLLILVLPVLFPVAVFSLPLYFQSNRRVFVSMYRRYLQCWWIFFSFFSWCMQSACVIFGV